MTSPADDRVAQIRARAEAATPGPWSVDRNLPFSHEIVGVFSDGIRKYVYELEVGGDDDEDEDETDGRVEPDAEFIAAARSDIPYLLDQLAEAERNLASVYETMQDALRSNEQIREMAAGFMAERDAIRVELTEARRQLAEADDAHVSYAPGYLKGPEGDEYVRLLSPYMGETIRTLDEAKAWVAEEEHDKYMSIIYFEIRPVVAALGVQQ